MDPLPDQPPPPSSTPPPPDHDDDDFYEDPPVITAAVPSLSSDEDEDDSIPDSDLDEFDQLQCERVPDEDTVIHHRTFNLPQLGIVVNTRHRVIICLTCEYTTSPATLVRHIKTHFPGTVLLDNIGATLKAEYQLLDPASVKIPRNNPAPIFGLKIEPKLLYFCVRCNRGYKNQYSLRAHQSGLGRCPRLPGQANGSIIGHGQSFILGPNRRFFRVDVSKLRRQQSAAKLFVDTFPPSINFSQIPLGMPDNEQDLGQFAHREHWMEHLSPYTPDQITDAARATIPQDGVLHSLRPFTIKYMYAVQALIKKHASFGINKLIAQVGE
jgi:hypothetical protein